jgi:hypothetical protein
MTRADDLTERGLLMEGSCNALLSLGATSRSVISARQVTPGRDDCSTPTTPARGLRLFSWTSSGHRSRPHLEVPTAASTPCPAALPLTGDGGIVELRPTDERGVGAGTVGTEAWAFVFPGGR